jgi:Transglutaminase-like superfamily
LSLVARGPVQRWRSVVGLAPLTLVGAAVGVVLCPLAAVMVRVVPFRWYRSLVKVHDGRAVDLRAQQFSRGITLAARNSPLRVRCLAESVTLTVLLRVFGYSARMMVGVADPRGTFRAHAWVMVDDVVVGSTNASTRGFATLGFAESQ